MRLQGILVELSRSRMSNPRANRKTYSTWGKLLLSLSWLTELQTHSSACPRNRSLQCSQGFFSKEFHLEQSVAHSPSTKVSLSKLKTKEDPRLLVCMQLWGAQSESEFLHHQCVIRAPEQFPNYFHIGRIIFLNSLVRTVFKHDHENHSRRDPYRSSQHREISKHRWRWHHRPMQPREVWKLVAQL